MLACGTNYKITFMTRSFSLPRTVGALLAFAAMVSSSVQAAAPVTSASGLVYESLKEGTGASPKASDTVRVHYRGTFPESGKEPRLATIDFLVGTSELVKVIESNGCYAAA